MQNSFSKIIYSLFFLFLTTFCLAQTPDVFRLEYTLLPENDAEVSLSRIKLVGGLPMKVLIYYMC